MQDIGTGNSSSNNDCCTPSSNTNRARQERRDLSALWEVVAAGNENHPSLYTL